jgi:5-methylthioadenosine/S-adenosylhomocysteine deaminase
MTRTLIRGGCVLTLGRANFPEADVLIEDGVIAEIAPRLRTRDADVIDAGGTIVMPGFVDTHRHVGETLFRHLPDDSDATPDTYLPHYQADDIYAATLLGLLGAVDAGITAVVDWCPIGADPTVADAALQAHVDAGTRSVLIHASAPWGGDGWREAIRRSAATDRPGLVSAAAGPPEPMSNALDAAADDWSMAREVGFRVHAHAGTTPAAVGTVSAMAARRLVGDDVTLVHCSHVDDADLDALATSGGAVSIAPSSEMAGPLGSPPLQRMLDRGIRPGLGIDSERIAPGDMFAQMRAVMSLQHALYFDLKLAGKAGLPRLMTTRDAIRLATIDGARVAGLGDAVGALEPGMQADVIVLRADLPNIVPVNDPIGAVVWGMDTSNVDTVLVGGRALKRGGVVDAGLSRVASAASTARDRVAGAAGLLTRAGSGR